MPIMKTLLTMFSQHEFKFSWWDTSNCFGQEMIILGGEIVESEPIKRICMYSGCNEEDDEWVRDREWYCAKHAAMWEDACFGFDKDEQLFRNGKHGNDPEMRERIPPDLRYGGTFSQTSAIWEVIFRLARNSKTIA